MVYIILKSNDDTWLLITRLPAYINTIGYKPGDFKASMVTYGHCNNGQ